MGHDQDKGLANYVFGKTQPAATDLEQAVLGAMLLDRDAVPDMLDQLRVETFYTDQHQNIFKAIKSLYEKQEPVDLLTVVQELKLRGSLELAGGGYYITELSHRVASAANIEFHSRILIQKELQRRIIEAATKATRDAYEDTTDAFNLLAETEQAIFEISKRLFNKDAAHISEGTHAVLLQLEAAMKNDGVTGIETGIFQLDKEVGGLQDGNLYVVAARPGMGKTALVLSWALSMAERGVPVGLFSLEMSTAQLVERGISSLSSVSVQSMKSGELTDRDWQDIQTAIEKINKFPIHIDDTPGLSVLAVRARARRMVQKHGVRVIIVDYLQLMSGDDTKGNRGNREQEIATIARALKNLAKELGVPVVALSQLSRAVETRGGSKRPQLSDLRESGEIENAADLVGFLYRPEYYQIFENESGQSLKGIAEFIIAKHRHGKLVDVPMAFVDRICLFKDVDPNNPLYSSSQDFTTSPKPFNHSSVDYTESKSEIPELVTSTAARDAIANNLDLPF